MCFTNVNKAGIRYGYFMYSTNKCTDFNKNITLYKKKKKKKIDLLNAFNASLVSRVNLRKEISLKKIIEFCPLIDTIT